MLTQISHGTYDRWFAATELLDLVSDHEDRVVHRSA